MKKRIRMVAILGWLLLLAGASLTSYACVGCYRVASIPNAPANVTSLGMEGYGNGIAAAAGMRVSMVYGALGTLFIGLSIPLIRHRKRGEEASSRNR